MDSMEGGQQVGQLALSMISRTFDDFTNGCHGGRPSNKEQLHSRNPKLQDMHVPQHDVHVPWWQHELKF